MTPLELTSGETESAHDGTRTSPGDRSARRLAACAAACDGIPTAELENGILVELVAACVRLRDDERVRDILLRLSPLRSGPVRLVPPAEEIDREPESVVEASRPEAPAADEAAAEAPAATEGRFERPVEVLRTPRARAGPMAAPPRRQTASEKFRIGLRVKISPTGYAMMPPTIASPTGVVFGFSRSPYAVRVIRDGRTSSETFDMDFWEEDPDYRDANESIVSGLRAPFRSAPADWRIQDRRRRSCFSPRPETEERARASRTRVSPAEGVPEEGRGAFGARLVRRKTSDEPPLTPVSRFGRLTARAGRFRVGTAHSRQPAKPEPHTI